MIEIAGRTYPVPDCMRGINLHELFREIEIRMATIDVPEITHPRYGTFQWHKGRWVDHGGRGMTLEDWSRKTYREVYDAMEIQRKYFGRCPDWIVFDEAHHMKPQTKPLTAKQKRENKMKQLDILKEATLLVTDELRGAKVLKVKDLLAQQKAIKEKINKVLAAETVEAVKSVY